MDGFNVKEILVAADSMPDQSEPEPNSGWSVYLHHERDRLRLLPCFASSLEGGRLLRKLGMNLIAQPNGGQLNR